MNTPTTPAQRQAATRIRRQVYAESAHKALTDALAYLDPAHPHNGHIGSHMARSLIELALRDLSKVHPAFPRPVVQVADGPFSD